jgi:SAM-dependent methyltransferase
MKRRVAAPKGHGPPERECDVVRENATRSVTTGKRRACRFCGADLRHVVVDLGMSPLCESYVPPERLGDMEPFYPLVVYVCESCFLVQVEELVPPETIFTEYAYFSSYADSWVEHAERFADSVTRRLDLGPGSLVVELASNDGYLLQHFVRRGVPVLGIEPAANVAAAATAKGIPTEVTFFGETAAKELRDRGKLADLVVANNVLAQVPDLNGFIEGIRLILKPGAVATFEFPHLRRLIDGNQFDTIYHEHFSYFSFTTAREILRAHGLRVFDVEELSTHGGSLRVWASADGPEEMAATAGVGRLLASEDAAGVRRPDSYDVFARRVAATKRALLRFLIEQKEAGRTIAGYGAPGKGNTLLNYCGIRRDFLDYTVDRNPYKQGRFLPGTRIPIHPVERIAETRPDFLLILPWNFREEIMTQMSFIRDWGGRFVVPIPEVRVHA